MGSSQNKKSEGNKLEDNGKGKEKRSISSVKKFQVKLQSIKGKGATILYLFRGEVYNSKDDIKDDMLKSSGRKRLEKGLKQKRPVKYDINSIANIRKPDKNEENYNRDLIEPDKNEKNYNSDLIEHDKNEENYNRDLIEHFKHEGFSKEQSGISETDLGILAELRHHGAANSLIDFTSNPLVALWFACQSPSKDGKSKDAKSEDDTYGVVYILKIKVDDNFCEIYTEKQLKKHTIEKIFKQDKWFYWKPAALNKRIPVQSSYLLIGKESLDNKLSKKAKAHLKEIGIGMDANKTDKSAESPIDVILIKDKDKRKLLKELSTFYNIDATTLFPDMSGFAMVNSEDRPYDKSTNAQRRIRASTKDIYELKDELKDELRKVKTKKTENHKEKELEKELADAYYSRGDAKNVLGYDGHEKEWYRSAIADFKEAKNLIPKHTNAYKGLGNAWFMLGTLKGGKKDNAAKNNALHYFSNALHYFTKVIELDPKDTSAYNNRAVTKWELGKLKGDEKAIIKETIKDFDEAIKLDPQDTSVYNNRAQVQLDLAKLKKDKKEKDATIKEAIKDFDKEIVLNPESPYPYHRRGQAQLELAKLKKDKKAIGKVIEKAIADFGEAIKLDPEKNAIPYNNRGSARWELGNLKRDGKTIKEAIKDFGEAIVLDPEYADPYSSRGSAKLGLARLKGDEKAIEEAIKDFDKEIVLNPESPYPYHRRGQARLELAKLKKDKKAIGKVIEKAIADFGEAIKLDPGKNAIPYNNRGSARWELGKLKRDEKAIKSAIKDFGAAIVLDPEYDVAYNGRGVAKRELGNLKKDEKAIEEAIEDFTKAIGLDPKYADPYNSRGLVKLDLAKLKEDEKAIEEAIKDFDKAIEFSSKDAVSAAAHNNRGLAKYQLEIFKEDKQEKEAALKEAIKDYNRAMGMDPRCANTYSKRGRAMLKLGKLKKDEKSIIVAVEDLTMAIALNPEDADVYHFRGCAYKELEMKEEAKRDFAKAKELGYEP